MSWRTCTPHLLARDIEATVAFYVELLGFTVETLWPAANPTLCVLDRHGVHLVFDTGANWDAPRQPPTLSGQLVFEVDDVDRLHESLVGRVEILWGPESYDYGRREFSIRDPDGYRLVFSQRADPDAD